MVILAVAAGSLRVVRRELVSFGSEASSSPLDVAQGDKTRAFFGL